MVSTVSYQIATYSGEVQVYGVEPNDETETVIARARAQLRRQLGGSLPFGAESWRETSRDDEI